jgi:hypothetical protein
VGVALAWALAARPMLRSTLLVISAAARWEIRAKRSSAFSSDMLVNLPNTVNRKTPVSTTTSRVVEASVQC